MFIYISFVIMFALQFVASAQNDEVEVSLNKYEELCAQCLDMKSKVAAGEHVSKYQAQSQVALFLDMNKELKGRQSEMTSEQSARFAAIGQWFTSGVRPEILDRKAVAQSADTQISDTLSLVADVKIAEADSVGTQKPDTLLPPPV